MSRRNDVAGALDGIDLTDLDNFASGFPHRLFELHRDHDVSGVSGTGVVAEGVEFSDGTCVVRWRSGVGSTGVWHSIKDVEAIHGHGGATRVVWLEPHPARAH